ncbi:MAG: hypothetical protein H0T83_08620 [Chthoniobacterales bacterium]|nr:hypothetical protein [Chthoniobacterales bacterium]
MLSGLAGGIVTGTIAPRLPFAHAAGVLLFLALDTAFVLSKGNGPAWFDLAGSSVLALSVLLGGWMISKWASIRRDRAVARPLE